MVYIGQTIAPGQFGDVKHLIVENEANDPEREALGVFLRALQTTFGNRMFAANDVYKACMRGVPDSETSDGRLYEAIVSISPNPKLSVVGIGKILKYKRNKISDGLELKLVSDNKNGRTWRVVGVA